MLMFPPSLALSLPPSLSPCLPHSLSRNPCLQVANSEVVPSRANPSPWHIIMTICCKDIQLCVVTAPRWRPSPFEKGSPSPFTHVLASVVNVIIQEARSVDPETPFFGPPPFISLSFPFLSLFSGFQFSFSMAALASTFRVLALQLTP